MNYTYFFQLGTVWKPPWQFCFKDSTPGCMHAFLTLEYPYISDCKPTTECSEAANNFAYNTGQLVQSAKQSCHTKAEHQTGNKRNSRWGCLMFPLAYQPLHCHIFQALTYPSPVVFNLFCSHTPRYNFCSTLYPESCWCIIQVIHKL
jgi:hypothetical protein